MLTFLLKVNPVWKCKIKLERGVPAQIFSTHHRDGAQALKVATKKLDVMRSQHALGMSISVRRFDEIARDHLTSLSGALRGDNCSPEKYRLHERTINECYIPEFGNYEIAKITASVIKRYFIKRARQHPIRVYHHKGMRRIVRLKKHIANII